jgi:Flp pilus assembly secretin CpaC
LALAISLSGTAAALAAEQISVTVDQAKLVKLPEKVATIVIGNPLIADVSVQANGLMVVTGKGYGTTNALILDRNGNVLAENTIEVKPPREGVVVVYRGVNKESYSCMPNCERRITLGDAPAYFGPTLSQTVTRAGQAQGAGAANNAGPGGAAPPASSGPPPR